MYENYIEKLDELIYEYTGRRKFIVKKDITLLTRPGENYCSLMLKIDVTLKNLDSGDEEILYTVAKCVNRLKENFFRLMSPWQFKKEIRFYTEIVPILQEFQREQGIVDMLDLFPKVYAVRRNLNGVGNDIDDHAVILMENLKVQGYASIERTDGFELDGAKMVLKDISTLQAAVVALKLKKPDVFEKSVKPLCTIHEDFPNVPKPEGDFKMPIWVDIAESIAECKPYIEKVKENLTKYMQDSTSWFNRPCNEPLASIIHCDLWTNNTMQKFEAGKKPNNKIIDFQIYSYGNPILDMIFFVWSCVKEEIVKEHFEDLVAFYQKQFFTTLQTLGCDLNICEYHNFMEDVDRDAGSEIIHLLFMAVPIFGVKDESAVDFDAEVIEMIKESSVTPTAKQRIVFLLTEFGRRGWLDRF